MFAILSVTKADEKVKGGEVWASKTEVDGSSLLNPPLRCSEWGDPLAPCRFVPHPWLSIRLQPLSKGSTPLSAANKTDLGPVMAEDDGWSTALQDGWAQHQLSDTMPRGEEICE